MPEIPLIPAALVQATAERRLIPFVGAGFSASVGLPRWHELLERVAASLPSDIPFEDLDTMCDHDPMRVAEYLYLVAGKEIGPIRHRISHELTLKVDPTLSGPHVELINLGARRIYTTNYDDAIEQTFAGLHEPFDPIATPRHVARASGAATEVVKYHGDLQWEQTLVLTESSYHERLTFESPLDIKFRSDLLGNSVLFLGYGLGDLNVRVIWHRLLAMMSGVDPAERPRSFIVRLEQNPAREALDAAAGITTVVLDEADQAPQTRVARFLMELVQLACPDGHLGGSGRPMFMSVDFVELLKSALADEVAVFDSTDPPCPFSRDQLVDQSARRRIPGALRVAVEELIDVAKGGAGAWASEVLDALVPNHAAHFLPEDEGAVPEAIDAESVGS